MTELDKKFVVLLFAVPMAMFCLVYIIAVTAFIVLVGG